MTVEDTPFTTYALNTTVEPFTKSLQERFTKKEGYAGSEYRFWYDSKEKKINLQELKQAVWITNNMPYRIAYKIKWAPGEEFEQTYTLDSNKAKPHWSKHPVMELPYDYPKIEFQFKPPSWLLQDRYDERTHTIITKDFTYTRIQTLKTKTQFFDIGTTSEENIIEVKGSARTGENAYRFVETPLPDLGGLKLMDIHYSLPSPATSNDQSPSWISRYWRLIVILVFGFIAGDFTRRVFPKVLAFLKLRAK